MSDLHQAVRAEIAAHTPALSPSFDALKARKRARDRRRSIAAVAVSVLAVAGVAFGPSALLDGGSGSPAQIAHGGGAGRGEPALWEVDRAQPPERGERTFTALVSRLGCASGVTGDVLAPQVVESEDEVVITFTVAPLTGGGADCPTNKPVAYSVTLKAPLGTRTLRDGTCETPPARTTAPCLTPQRWPSER